MAQRTLNVTECAVIKRGTTGDGRPWTLYRIKAADTVNGQLVDAQLTSFQRVALGQHAYEVEHRGDDPKYGKQFTLKLVDGSEALADEETVASDVADRLAALEEKVALLAQRVPDQNVATTSLPPAANGGGDIDAPPF